MEDQLQELLTITMEECGELIQACSKAIRCDDYHNNEKLIEEIGDVQCMIDLIRQYDLVSLTEINNQVNIKEKKLKKWSNLI
jgi:NTP pyrophosphatase (non-canonical NTP hydrolase)|tara:strand:+ start:43 stop:288 length:246 start_codon:yes stop_codon:yes gene_type:complete